MSNKYRELIECFRTLQTGLCDSLARAIAEKLDCDCSSSFSSVSISNLENALSEYPGKASVLQYSYEEVPEHRQWIILPEEFTHKETIVNTLARYFSLSPSSIELLNDIPSDLHAKEMICSRYRIETGDHSLTLIWLFDEEVLQKIVGGYASNIEQEYQTHVLEKPEQKERDLEMLMDIPLDINVELGRVKLTVQKILELTPGNIIELDKTAGEPVDVFVNGRLVAKGEVVVVEDNFGVRITEILSSHDRISKLSEAA